MVLRQVPFVFSEASHSLDTGVLLEFYKIISQAGMLMIAYLKVRKQKVEAFYSFWS